MEIGNILFGNSRGEFPIEREDSQNLFGTFFSLAGLDCYGYADKGSVLEKYSSDNGEYYSIDTELFSIMPYYWGYDEKVAKMPNFIYKPENIEIQWYKYPLRDAYSNVPLSFEKIKEMILACLAWITKEGEEKGDR